MGERLTRVPDWRPRLKAYINSKRREPYVPGVNDCAMFCAGAVYAMTERDLFPDLPKYKSIEEGLESVRALGFDDHIDYASSFLTEKPVQDASPGDLAVIPGNPHNSLGIVQGESIYALGYDALGRSVLGLVPLSAALRVFEV